MAIATCDRQLDFSDLMNVSNTVTYMVCPVAYRHLGELFFTVLDPSHARHTLFVNYTVTSIYMTNNKM